MKESNLNDETRVPLRWLFLCIAAAVTLTGTTVGEWLDMRWQAKQNRDQIEMLGRSMVSEQQFQQWLDDAREMDGNRKLPRLPIKESRSPAMDAVANGRTRDSMVDQP